MRQDIISFRGIAFPSNPAMLEVHNERTVRKLCLPLLGETIQNLGTGAQRITGSGIFSGTGAYGDYMHLHREYARGGDGWLLLPGFYPVRALFARLQAKALPGNEIAYEFSFIQTQEPVPGRAGPDTYIIKKGETLWEVSARLGVPIHALMSWNPQYASPFDPVEGEEVKIACDGWA